VAAGQADPPVGELAMSDSDPGLNELLIDESNTVGIQRAGLLKVRMRAT
jgi:hypothetical protein